MLIIAGRPRFQQEEASREELAQVLGGWICGVGKKKGLLYGHVADLLQEKIVKDGMLAANTIRLDWRWVL